MGHDQRPDVKKVGEEVSIFPVLGLCLLLVLSFWPLALWMGRSTMAQEQLNTGGIMVLISIWVCLRGAWPRLRVRPQLNNLGLALLPVCFVCLWVARRVPALTLPLVVFGFCAALAAMISFFFGESGVRIFLPALSGVFVLGLLVGLSPVLDWPLRNTAAEYAGNLLAHMGLAVQVREVGGMPSELLLTVGDKAYIVATECNGFGLLSSSLVLSAILSFSLQLPWFRKIGLLFFAAPTAIMFNMFRIISICLAVPRVNLPYAVLHEGLGLAFYAGGLGLVWWMAERAARLTKEEESALPEADQPRAAP
jgi:exosortase/archaeosortase family protein